MTESQWSQAKKPDEVFLPRLHTMSMRKTRLLVCAYCHHIWDKITHPHRDRAIAIAERYADGEVDERELWPAFDSAMNANRLQDSETFNDHNIFVQLAVDGGVAMSDVLPPLGVIVRAGKSFYSKLSRTQQIEQSFQTALIRDIFGNPFRPVAFDTAWHTETAVALATGIYAERAFDRMPILADALEDAGCNNKDILSHLRSDGTHVKGCWVLDLILGKS